MSSLQHNISIDYANDVRTALGVVDGIIAQVTGLAAGSGACTVARSWAGPLACPPRPESEKTEVVEAFRKAIIPVHTEQHTVAKTSGYRNGYVCWPARVGQAATLPGKLR